MSLIPQNEPATATPHLTALTFASSSLMGVYYGGVKLGIETNGENITLVVALPARNILPAKKYPTTSEQLLQLLARNQVAFHKEGHFHRIEVLALRSPTLSSFKCTDGSSWTCTSQMVKQLRNLVAGKRDAEKIGTAFHISLREIYRHGPEREVVRVSPGQASALTEMKTLVTDTKVTVLNDLVALGLSKLVPSIERSMVQAFERFESVIKLHRWGYTPEGIHLRIGISANAVRDWISGKRLPLGLKHRVTTRKQRTKVPLDLRKECCSRAYLLGHTRAMQHVGSVQANLRYLQRSPEVAGTLAHHLSIVSGKVYGSADREIGGIKYYEVCLGLREMVPHIATATYNNTTTPWELLVTKEERRNYVMGVADGLSSVIPDGPVPYIDFTKRRSREMIESLAWLMTGFKIYPCVMTSSCVLHILQSSNIKQFAETIGYRDTRRATLLARAVNRRVSRRDYTVDEYDAVLNEAAAHPNLSTTDLARRVDIDRDIIRSWTKRGVIPDSVKKKIRIEELFAKYPDPDSIGLLYREVGLSSQASRKLAVEFTLKELTSRLERLQASKHSWKESTPEEREQMLRSGVSRIVYLPLESAEIPELNELAQSRLALLGRKWSALHHPMFTAERVLDEVNDSYPEYCHAALRAALLKLLPVEYGNQYREFLQQNDVGISSFWKTAATSRK